MNRKLTDPSFQVYSVRRSSIIDRSDGWEDWAREFVQGKRTDLNNGASPALPSAMVLSRLLNA